MLATNTASTPIQPSHQPKLLLNKHYAPTMGRGISQSLGGEGERMMAQDKVLVEKVLGEDLSMVMDGVRKAKE